MSHEQYTHLLSVDGDTSPAAKFVAGALAGATGILCILLGIRSISGILLGYICLYGVVFGERAGYLSFHCLGRAKALFFSFPSTKIHEENQHAIGAAILLDVSVGGK
jgi:hypothetical protein